MRYNIKEFPLMHSPRYHRAGCKPSVGCISFLILGLLILIVGIIFGVLIKHRDEYNQKFHNSFVKTNGTILDTYVEDNDYKCTCVQSTCLPCILYKAVVEVEYIGVKNESLNGTLYKDTPDKIDDYDDAVIWAVNEYPIGDNIDCFYNTLKSGRIYWEVEEFTSDESKSRLIASVIVLFVLFITGISCCIAGIYRMKCKACDEETYIPVGTV